MPAMQHEVQPPTYSELSTTVAGNMTINAFKVMLNDLLMGRNGVNTSFWS